MKNFKAFILKNEEVSSDEYNFSGCKFRGVCHDVHCCQCQRIGFILFSLFWATWIHPMSLEVRTIGYLQVL